MHPSQLFDEALRFHRANKLPEAERLYRQLLAMAPRYADALNMLGFLFHQTERDKRAIPLYRQAIKINSNFAPFHSNLAHALQEIGDREGALRSFRQALQIDPYHCDAGIGLAIILRELGQLEASIATLRSVLLHSPDDFLAHTNLGFALLMRGEFEQGWMEMEWRIRDPQMAATYGSFRQRKWPGPNVASGRLLVQAEQGLGDSIQFCRYVLMASALGLGVTLEVQEPLVRLFRSLSPNITVVVRGTPRPNYDYHIPLMSLPQAFSTTLQTIPATIPYLVPEVADVERWGQRLAEIPRAGLRIGIIWAGAPRYGNAEARSIDRTRSLDPMLLKPLLEIPRVVLISLQKDVRPPRSFPVLDFMETVSDMADTAALITNLDVVISVDSAIAHLAAALGRPTWLLDRYNHDWRWLIGRDTTPWYPTMRIYRQSVIGQWKPVIGRVVTDLQRLVSKDFQMVPTD